MNPADPNVASIDKVIEKIKKDEEKEEKSNKIFTAIMQKTAFLREENNRLTCKLETLEQQTEEARIKIAIKHDEIRFHTMETKIMKDLHDKLAKENEKKSRELDKQFEDLWDIRRKHIASVRQKIEKIKSKTPDPVELQTLREMLEGTYGKPKTPPPSPIREAMEEDDDDEMVRLLDELEHQNELQRQNDLARKNAEMQRQNELATRQAEMRRQAEIKRQITARQIEMQRQELEKQRRKNELTAKQTELQRQRQEEMKRQNELTAKQSEMQRSELEEQRRKNELARQKMNLKQLQRQNIEDEMLPRITEYNSTLSQQRRWQSNSGTCTSDNLAVTRAPPRPASQSSNVTRNWPTMQTSVPPTVPSWQNRAPIGRGSQTFERSLPIQPRNQPNPRGDSVRVAAPSSQSAARANVPSFNDLMSEFDEPPQERREETTTHGVFKLKKPSQFYRPQQSF